MCTLYNQRNKKIKAKNFFQMKRNGKSEEKKFFKSAAERFQLKAMKQNSILRQIRKITMRSCRKT
jgi:hypothetical protein